MKNKKSKLTILLMLSMILFIIIGSVSMSSNVVTNNSKNLAHYNSASFKVNFSSSNRSVKDGKYNLVKPVSGSGSYAFIENSGVPTIWNLSANLTSVGDEVIYEFYTINTGDYDAYLTSIIYNNVIGTRSDKVCIAGTASNELVAKACDSINVKVNVQNFGEVDSTTQIKGHKLSRGKFEKIIVTISYDANPVDGTMEVIFGNISLIYSQIDNERGLTSGK